MRVKRDKGRAFIDEDRRELTIHSGRHPRRLVWLCLLALSLSACSAEPASTPTVSPSPAIPSRTPLPTATDVPTPTQEGETGAGFTGAALSTHRGEYFTGSGVCALCHRGLLDEAGKDVSMDGAWRSTMMANAARDPYWQATVHAEVNLHPESRDILEGLCSRCHMPMAHFTASQSGEELRILDGGFLDSVNPLHELAMDGVSCSLCHQIREDGLGFPDSFSGGFAIDEELEIGRRVIFGPYTIEQDQTRIMEVSSGFVPLQGLHISESELCAVCHTLFTPIFNAQGEETAEFPEQVPYLEWWYSDYRRLATCQDCHMPEAEGGVRIATTSSVLRSPFGQHTFVGGNVQVLRIFEAFGDEIGVAASSEQFSQTLEATLRQLQSDTASLELEDVRLSGSRLTVDLRVTNLTGHKFPTAFPSRRAWLHVLVTDSAGSVVFESGGYTPQGAIIGNDNDEDPARFEQHYQAIVQEEQVQIYETILRDMGGGLTTDVVSVVGFVKDNRILPQGLEKVEAIEAIRVWGLALDDESFNSGEDRIQYVVDLSGSAGPYILKIELLYQPIGFRWIESLRGFEAGEITRFLDYFDSLPNLPVAVSQVQQVIGE